MKKIIVIPVFALSFLLITFVVQSFKTQDQLVVTFCDVGQGDGAYIRTPKKHDIVIDAGPDSSILNCIGANMPFWDRKIDLIILSHFNLDHVAGVVDIVNRYDVKRIAVSTVNSKRQDVKDYMMIFKDKNIDIDDIDVNDKYKIEDGIAIKTLGPIDNPGLIEDNNSSLVQLLSYKNYDFLFTGDSSYEVLNPILNRLGREVEVLKVPHHGSKTGLNKESFNTFKPKIAVISSGKKNRYGHPHAEVINLLKDNAVEIRRTDEEGNIKFVLK